jgi:hypothetical protein
VCKGQRLLALRTHTGGQTLYLFDHDGERPGWVSGTVVEAAGLDPLYETIYIGIVTSIWSTKQPGARFTIVLSKVDQKPGTASSLRSLEGWPNTLGEEQSDLETNFPDLYKVLTTTQPGAPAHASKGTSVNNVSVSKAAAGRISRTVAANKDAMENAAFLEAGFIANKQVTKLLSAKAPLMVRGYIDSPVGKLVIANLFSSVIAEFRPNHSTLGKLSHAMMVDAHQEIIKTLDIDGLIDELLSAETIKRALSKIEGAAE